MTALAEGQRIGPLTVPVTRTTLVRYAGASGDFNPIHHSDHAARELGLDGVIAHGMLTLAIAMRAVTDAVGGPGRVVGQYARFRKPVPVPDDGVGVELVVTGEVAEIVDGIATIRLEVMCGEEKVLGQASAQVRVD
ncbi:MaoC/PaaZ C-terminal domain-containing protein [Naumannella huperziae]